MFENITFRQIRDLKRQLPGFEDVGISDFSELLNQATGSQIANAGIGGKFETGVKHYSAGVDDLLNTHAAPVVDFLGEAGAGLFNIFGADEATGRAVGRESLRGVADFLPAIAGTAIGLVPGGWGWAPAAGLSASAALGAANAAEKTDSVPHTVLAAGMPFLGGPVAGTAGKATLNLLGKGTRKLAFDAAGNPVEQFVAKKIGDKAISIGAGEAAINVASMVGGSVADRLAYGQWTNPFTKENILANMVDPTILLGGLEFFDSPVLRQRALGDAQTEQTRNTNAEIEDSAKLPDVDDPQIVPGTGIEIEKQYNEFVKQLDQIPDENQREATRIKLDKAKRAAYAQADLQPQDVATVMGEALNTQLSKKDFPVTVKEVAEDGTVTEREVTAADVVKSESELEQAREAGLSDQAVVRSERLREQEANTYEDVQQILEDVNIIRDDLNDEPVLDDVLAAEFEDAIEMAADVEEAAEVVVESVRQETLDNVKEAKSGKKTQAPDLNTFQKETEKRFALLSRPGQALNLVEERLAQAPKRGMQRHLIMGAYNMWRQDQINKKHDGGGEAFRKLEAALNTIQSKTFQQDQAAKAGEKGGRPKKPLGDDELDQLAMDWIANEEAIAKGDDGIEGKAWKIYEKYMAPKERTKGHIYMINEFKRWHGLRQRGQLEHKGKKQHEMTEAEQLERLEANMKGRFNQLNIQRRKGWKKVKRKTEGFRNWNKVYDPEKLGDKVAQEARDKQIDALAAKHPEIEFIPVRHRKKYAIDWKPRGGLVDELANVNPLDFNEVMDRITAIPGATPDDRQAISVNKKIVTAELNKIAANVVEKKASSGAVKSNVSDAQKSVSEVLGWEHPKPPEPRLPDFMLAHLNDIATEGDFPAILDEPRRLQSVLHIEKNLNQQLPNEVKNWFDNTYDFWAERYSKEVDQYQARQVSYENNKVTIELEAAGGRISQALAGAGLEELREQIKAKDAEIDESYDKNPRDKKGREKLYEEYYKLDKELEDQVKATFQKLLEDESLALVDIGPEAAPLHVGTGVKNAGAEHKLYAHPYDDTKVLKIANFTHTMKGPQDLPKYLLALHLHNKLLDTDFKLIGVTDDFRPVIEVTKLDKEDFKHHNSLTLAEQKDALADYLEKKGFIQADLGGHNPEFQSIYDERVTLHDLHAGNYLVKKDGSFHIFDADLFPDADSPSAVDGHLLFNHVERKLKDENLLEYSIDGQTYKRDLNGDVVTKNVADRELVKELLAFGVEGMTVKDVYSEFGTDYHLDFDTFQRNILQLADEGALRLRYDEDTDSYSFAKETEPAQKIDSDVKIIGGRPARIVDGKVVYLNHPDADILHTAREQYERAYPSDPESAEEAAQQFISGAEEALSDPDETQPMNLLGDDNVGQQAPNRDLADEYDPQANSDLRYMGGEDTSVYRSHNKQGSWQDWYRRAGEPKLNPKERTNNPEVSQYMEEALTPNLIENRSYNGDFNYEFTPSPEDADYSSFIVGVHFYDGYVEVTKSIEYNDPDMSGQVRNTVLDHNSAIFRSGDSNALAELRAAHNEARNFKQGDENLRYMSDRTFLLKAATRDTETGQIFEGPIHALAREEMANGLFKDQFKASDGDYAALRFIDRNRAMIENRAEDGFVDEAGTFYTRQQAAEIVNAEKQTDIKHLRTDDIHTIAVKEQSRSFGGSTSISPIQQFQQVRSPKMLMEGILKKKGWNQELIDSGSKYFEKLFDVYGADDVELFEILEGGVKGAANIKGPVARLFLGSKGLDGLTPEEQLRALSFVAGHELGHLWERAYNEGLLSNRQHQRAEEFVRWTDESNKEDHKLAMEIALEMVPAAMRNDEVVAKTVDAVGKPEEVRANLLSMWAMGQVAKVDTVALNLLPGPVKRAFRSLTTFARDVYGAMKGTGGILENYKRRTEMRKRVEEMVRMTHEMKVAHRQSAEFDAEGRKLGLLDSHDARMDAQRLWGEDTALGRYPRYQEDSPYSSEDAASRHNLGDRIEWSEIRNKDGIAAEILINFGRRNDNLDSSIFMDQLGVAKSNKHYRSNTFAETVITPFEKGVVIESNAMTGKPNLEGNFSVWEWGDPQLIAELRYAEQNLTNLITGKTQELRFMRDTGSVVPEDTRGGLVTGFDNVVMPFDQLAQMVPSLRGLNAVLHNFVGGTKATVKRIVGSLTGGQDANGMPIFETNDDALKFGKGEGKPLTKLDFEHVRDKPRLNKIASDWMRAMQNYKYKGADGNVATGKMLSYAELEQTHPELRQRLDALSGEERNAVVQTVHRFHKAMEQFQFGEAQKVMDAGNVAVLKSMIAAKRPDLFTQAPELAKLMYDGITKLRTLSDPMIVKEGENMLAQVEAVVPKDLFQRMAEVVREQHAVRTELMADFTVNKHFFSEIRVGKFFLHWVEPGGNPKKDTGGLAFDSKKDMEVYRQKLRDRGVTSITLETTKRGSPYLVGRDKFMEALNAYDERNKEFVKSLGLDGETERQLLSVLDYESMFQKELKAEKIVHQGAQRGFKAGREDLDMIQTQFAYFNAASRAMHKKILNNEIKYHLNNPELKDPKVARYLPQVHQHLENFMNPDTRFGTNTAMANAAYFLGLNLSSHMVELVQPVFTFLPELQNHGVGFVQANKMLMDAQKHVSRFTMKHLPSQARRLGKKGTQLSKGIDNNAMWDNPEYVKLMQFAAENDWISLAHASDVVDVDLSTNLDVSGLMGRNGRARESAASRYGITPIKNFARNTLKLYQQFTEYNARVSLIAGYELAKQKGLRGQGAINFAGEFSRTVTFSGGKVNRPTALFSNTGHFRTVGQALYSLQGYSFGMLGMMRRYAETAFSKKQYPNMSHQDRIRARNALITMVAAQFLGAGMVGLPFMQAANELFEKMTGIELEREFRQGLAEMLGEDEAEDGGILSDAIMHGAANSILGKVLPGAPDVGSRFAIGGVMGVNAYDGFSLSSLVGPTGSLVENLATGATSLLKDRDAAKAFEDIAPIAWKKIINLARGGGELRDKSGGLLIDADWGEKMAYAVGFTPQRVRRMKNAERLERKHEQALRDRDIKMYNELADLWERNPIAAREQLIEMAQEDPKVQMFKDYNMPQGVNKATEAFVRQGGQKIAERIERRNHERDPRRDGTFKSTAGSQSLIRALGQDGRVSESARLQTRDAVMRSMGLAPVLTRATMSRAALIDQIMSQNPTMSRPQAAALADQTLTQNPALRRTLAPAGL